MNIISMENQFEHKTTHVFGYGDDVWVVNGCQCFKSARRKAVFRKFNVQQEFVDNVEKAIVNILSPIDDVELMALLAGETSHFLKVVSVELFKKWIKHNHDKLLHSFDLQDVVVKERHDLLIEYFKGGYGNAFSSVNLLDLKLKPEELLELVIIRNGDIGPSVISSLPRTHIDFLLDSKDIHEDNKKRIACCCNLAEVFIEHIKKEDLLEVLRLMDVSKFDKPLMVIDYVLDSLPELNGILPNEVVNNIITIEDGVLSFCKANVDLSLDNRMFDKGPMKIFKYISGKCEFEESFYDIVIPSKWYTPMLNKLVGEGVEVYNKYIDHISLNGVDLERIVVPDISKGFCIGPILVSISSHTQKYVEYARLGKSIKNLWDKYPSLFIEQLIKPSYDHNSALMNLLLMFDVQEKNIRQDSFTATLDELHAHRVRHTRQGHVYGGVGHPGYSVPHEVPHRRLMQDMHLAQGLNRRRYFGSPYGYDLRNGLTSPEPELSGTYDSVLGDNDGE